MAFRSTPGGGLAVASDDPTHPIVTPNDTWVIALNSDARWREVKARVDALADMSGVGPGDVTDAAMAALLADPATRTSEGVDTRIHQAIEENADGVRPEWFREPEDVDDTASLQRCLDAAAGRPIVLTAGKRYTISSSLQTLGQDVHLIGRGATIHFPGQRGTGLTISTGNPVLQTTLAEATDISTSRWGLASTLGVTPGMLMQVKSSRSWYADPRPEANDARVSETHLVTRVVGSTVYTAAGANDGYGAVGETVEVTFYAPVRVRIEDLTISSDLPAYGAIGTTPGYTGLRVYGAAFPSLTDVTVDSFAAAGIRVYDSYGACINRPVVHRANNYYQGYGVQLLGCTDTLVDRARVTASRRGIDVSGDQVISLRTLVRSAVVVGGGFNSEGRAYGWEDGGATGAYCGGMGSHGPADWTVYEGCTTVNVHAPYGQRGLNESFINCRHIGRTVGGVFSLNSGSGTTITGAVVRPVATTPGAGKDTTMRRGGSNINSRRPESFVKVNSDYDGANSRIFIEGFDVEVQANTFTFAAGAVPSGQVQIGPGRAQMATPNSSTPAALLYHEGNYTMATGSRWTIMPIHAYRQGGTGGYSLTKGVNVKGAAFLPFGTADTTT